MPTAHSYIRFSSAKQGDGDSVARQEELIAKWRKDHPEYELGGLKFKDLGLSGYHGKHLENGFGKLLAAVETGAIKSGDYILVESIDRTGRLNPNDMLNILTGITGAGVNIVTLDDGIQYSRDPNAANNLFLLVAKVQQAYQYSDAISRRVKAAYKTKREKAGPGVFTERRTPLWLENTGTEIRLVESVAPYIVQIFEDYACGLGERRILNRIRGQHPLLANLNPTTIKKWLNNPVAIGVWQPWPVDGVEQAPIEGVYPAVISKELWYRVQKRLSSSTKIKSASSYYLLSGLVKCGVCGSNFCVVDTKCSPASMYCVKRHRLGAAGCTNSKSIPYMLLEFIRSTTYAYALQRASQSQHLTATDKRLIEIEGELKELHRQSANVVDNLAEYGRLPAITAKLDKITDAITKLENEQLNLQTTPAELGFDWAMDTGEDLLDTDPQRLNALLQGVGYQIVCNGKDITVNERSLENNLETQHYAYSHSSRTKGVYVYFDNGVEMHMLNPTKEQVAAELEAFLSQEPPTDEELVAEQARLAAMFPHKTVDIVDGEIVVSDRADAEQSY